MIGYLSGENIRILIAAASLFFGIWQYFRKQALRKVIINEAIEIHKNVAVALGATDSAMNAIRNGSNAAGEVGRAQGLCQAILHESAKLYCNLKKATIDDIDDLVAQEQLAQQYKQIYYSYSAPKRNVVQLFLKNLLKSGS